ncbi:MAG: hypothetical protein ACRDOU_33500 [Streptosporangiaceae bacterium]
MPVDAVAAAVVAGAGADALVGVTAGAEAGALVAVVAGALVGAVAGALVGVVAGAVPEAGDAGGAVNVNAGDDGDVAPLLLADAVLEGDSVLATRTPTPSAAPLSSVTRGMLTFMPSSTQSRRFPVRSHPRIGGPHRGREPS